MKVTPRTYADLHSVRNWRGEVRVVHCEFSVRSSPTCLPTKQATVKPKTNLSTDQVGNRQQTTDNSNCVPTKTIHKIPFKVHQPTWCPLPFCIRFGYQMFLRHQTLSRIPRA